MKRLAVEILHRDEVVTIDLADLVRLNDVRMIEASSDARLVDEHRDELGLVGEIRPKTLDDRQLAESRPCRASLYGQKHVGHAAVSELRDQLVLAERSLTHFARVPAV